MKEKPSLLLSILKMQCPNCRKGRLFNYHSIFPLSKLLDMPEHCEVCGQKTELETGFYFGTGYVSYALSIAILVATFLFYTFVFGLSYKNDSIMRCLISSILLLILLQPFLMRLSRVLYIYMFVRYGSNKTDHHS